MFIETHPKSKHSFLDWNSILFATNLFFKIVIREKRFFFGIDFSPYWPLVAFFFVPFVPNYLISVRKVVCVVNLRGNHRLWFHCFCPALSKLRKGYQVLNKKWLGHLYRNFSFSIDVRIVPSKLLLHISSLLTKFRTYLLFFTNP